MKILKNLVRSNKSLKNSIYSLNLYKFSHQNSKNETKENLSNFEKRNMEIFANIRDWWNPKGNMSTLHSFNSYRLSYIHNTLKTKGKSIEGKQCLDIGCGGGLLSEALVRLGGEVTGLDINPTSIDIASKHLELYKGKEREIFKYNHWLRNKLNYVEGTLENITSQFDYVFAFEVVEHVESPDDFIREISRVCKPNGTLFMSTLNRTYMSYFIAILVAENVTGMIQPGTHEWEKFVEVNEMENMLRLNGFGNIKIDGTGYNPISDSMFDSPTTMINYILSADKSDEKTI